MWACLVEKCRVVQGWGSQPEGWQGPTMAGPGGPPDSLEGRGEGGRGRKEKGGKHLKVLSRGEGAVLIVSELCTHSHL